MLRHAIRRHCFSQARQRVALALLALTLATPAARSAADEDVWPTRPPPCLILDHPYQPLHSASITYVPAVDFGDFGGSSVLEAAGQASSLYYYRTGRGGDFDVNADTRLSWFPSPTALRLPDFLAHLEADAGWTFRDNQGLAFQLRVYPGMNGDLRNLNGDCLFMPFSGAMIRAFNPELAGIIGFRIQPRFSRGLLPLAGIEWDATDVLHVKLQLPESRIEWFVAPDWSAHAGLQWRSMTYALTHDPFARDKISTEDWRATLGLNWYPSEDLRVTGEIGFAFSRKLHFEGSSEGPSNDVELNPAPIFGLAVGGPF